MSEMMIGNLVVLADPYDFAFDMALLNEYRQ